MPSSTATFLFTDIEGSTQIWERHPQAMQPALARHDALLAAAITAHGGEIVKRTGDGCVAVFPAAPAGVQAALAAQHGLAAEAWAEIAPDQVRVRMALHAGEAEARAGDYFGPALNRAARLMATGHGGQVLLSQTAADLVRDQLPPALQLRDLGQHRLKDLTQPEHIFQLVAPGLGADFPALQVLDASTHNLPVQFTHFIGREREMAEVRELLSETALLTLTGSGGTGKTRLSLQVAAELLPKFRDGAWLVELAPLADPALVVQTIAATLGVRQQPGRPLFDALSDFLRGKQLLLILDNCEHLIVACAEVASRLLGQCSRLKIMASSREALGIAGETTYPVPSLSLPTAGADLDQSEAARLFVDRARAVLPTFAVTPHNAAAIAQVCQRLDGIPLALELAAARVRLLSVEQIAVRLDDRFRLLTGGSRTALPRQQTLRALIDWSYALLDEPERQFLQVLSVFAGGWTLAAAEAVWGQDVLDRLTQLVNKSLVDVDQDISDEPRYRLLETIRQYARDKMFDTSDPAQWRSRHLQYFLQYALDAQPGINSRQMVVWLNQLEREHDNFRVAMEWALDPTHGDPLAALQLAEALGFYLARRGYNDEGLGWLNAAAAHGRAATQSVAAGEPELSHVYHLALARVLVERAVFDFGLGSNGAEARAAAEEAVELSRQSGDQPALGYALGVLGMTTAFWGDPASARRFGEEALALGRQLKDPRVIFMGLGAGLVADQYTLEDLTSMRPRLEEALSMAHAMGDPWDVAMTTLNLARLVGDSGNLEATRARYGEAVRLFAELGDRARVNGARSDLAHALRRFGQLDEAAALYGETLRGWQRLGARGAVAHQLESLAIIALARRQSARAARLLGAAEVLRDTSGSVRMAMERVEYDGILVDLRAQLPTPELDVAWSVGRAMGMDEAVDYALSHEPD